MDRASRARRSSANCDRFLHSTAMSDGRTPTGCPSGHGLPSGAEPIGSASSAAAWSPTQSASSTAVGSSAAVTRPRSLRPGAGTSSGTSGASARSSAWRVAAASRTRPVLRKLVDSRRTGVRPRLGREVVREPAQVARAGAPPAVDGLAGVADRGHRVPAAEQGAQQHQLRVAGVLVLVEQHDVVAAALGRPHLG